MTDQELTELEELVAMTTPEPWETFPERHDLVPELNGKGVQIILNGTAGGIFHWTPDGVFTAAARTAVPALIAEVRRLRRMLEDSHGELKEAGRGGLWDGGQTPEEENAGGSF